MTPPNLFITNPGGWLVLGLLLSANVAAVPMLEIHTTDQTEFDESELGPGKTATINYQVRLTGLNTTPGSEDLVYGYDLGFVYNPEVLTLKSFAFDPGNYLGDPDFLGSIQQDPEDDNSFFGPNFDPVHSTWDYRDNSNVNNPKPTGQTYLGMDTPWLGTPEITADWVANPGSIRFSEVTLLNNADLIALQVTNNPTPGTVPLVNLSFEADLSDYGKSPLMLVFTTDYFPQGGDELDVKISSPTQAKYPTRVNGEVVVPLPGTLPLLGLGLLGAAALRRASRRKDRI